VDGSVGDVESRTDPERSSVDATVPPSDISNVVRVVSIVERSKERQGTSLLAQ